MRDGLDGLCLDRFRTARRTATGAQTAIAPTGERPNRPAEISPVTERDLAQPAGTQWLSYHGDYTARRYADGTQIDRGTVARLRRVLLGDPPPLYPIGPALEPGVGRSGCRPPGRA